MVLIPVVLFLALRAPVPVLAFVAGVVALLAIRELLKLSEAYAIRPLVLPTYVFVGLFFLAIAMPGATPLLSTSVFVFTALSAVVLAPFLFLAIGMYRDGPKKTWEGAAASVIASVGVGMLMFHYALPISSALLRAHLIELRDGVFSNDQPSLIPVIVLSVVLNVAAQLGDLVESLIKRGAGAKDSGAILPGHGGMFDRIDALLFAAPVLWCYAAWRVMMQ